MYIQKHIKENSFILLVCTNSIETFLSYIFALRNNCTVMLADGKTKAKDINTLISVYNHDVIIAPSDVLQFLENNNTESINDFFDYGIMKLRKLRKKPLNKNILLLLPTSGSMGSKKFVILSRDNLRANTDSILKYLGICTKDRAVTNMPFSYTYISQ